VHLPPALPPPLALEGVMEEGALPPGANVSEMEMTERRRPRLAAQDVVVHFD